MESLSVRFILCLSALISLLAFATASTTDDDFISTCGKFMYKKQKPQGLTGENLKYICQRYKGRFYFATLYDVANRIPVYSAYTVDQLSCDGSQPSRRDSWFIEPELAGTEKQADMDTDKKSEQDWTTPVQAINDDYKDTGFDRGHLNPNFMHCDTARTATFTLTNSIPQDSCFNRIVWFHLESAVKDRFESQCAFSNANRYVITGAVPSKGEFIPQKDLIVEDRPDLVHERVNVPSHSWSVACCDASESSTGKSYFSGVIGENKAGGEVIEYSDYDLMMNKLSDLYGSDIRILADSCGSPSSAADDTLLG